MGIQSGALSIAIQSDGKIVAAGRTFDESYSDVLVVRYTSDGALDSSFDGDGIRTFSLGALDDYATKILQVSGVKLLIAGTNDIDFAAIRLNSNGSFDSTFGVNGIVNIDMNNTFDQLRDMVIDADGMIVVAGFSEYDIYDMAVLRLTPNGTLDSSFNLDGKLSVDINGTYDSAYAMAIQNDGKIVVVGATDIGEQYDLAVIRLHGVCSPSPVIQNITIAEGESYTIGTSTYVEAGTYEEEFVAVSGCDSVVVTQLSIITSVQTIEDLKAFKVWPSLFYDELNMSGTEPYGEISIADLKGQVIYSTSALMPQMKLDLSFLPAGSYFLIYNNQQQRKTQQVVKLK